MTGTRRVLIVGGGVVGLSLAFELAQRRHHVTLIERDRLGRQASWAGAGILAPANYHTAIHSIDRLAGLSHQLHSDWSRRLLGLTGIDNGYINCGGVYIARTAGDLATLVGSKLHWRDFQIPFEELDSNRLFQTIPVLQRDELSSGVWVPGEGQICNPHHIQALAAAATKLGVEIIQKVGDVVLLSQAGKVCRIQAGGRTIEFDQICLAAGPWTAQLLQQLAIRLPMIPVRGQMLLFKLPERLWQPIINEGSRYLVPRADGHVLAGSTIEEVGFDCRTTDRHVNELQQFAESLIPRLTISARVQTWAGLRPATFDGLPYLGRLPQFENVFVATGHFKTGLQQSTGTAVVMSDLMEGKSVAIDLSPFDPARLDNQSDALGTGSLT